MQITRENVLNLHKEKFTEKSFFICEKCFKEVHKSFTAIYDYWRRHREFVCQSCNLKKTYQKHYGVDHPLHIESIKNKQFETYKSHLEETKQKRKESNLKKFGVEHYWLLPEYRQKSKDTMLKRYGVSNASYIQKSKDKRVETSLKKYGVKNHAVLKSVECFEQLGLRVIDASQKLCECPKCHKPSITRISNRQFFNECCFKPWQNVEPVRASKKQIELFDFVKTLDNSALLNNRSIITPLELDIWIPLKQIAIEYNGSYWHGFNKQSKNTLKEFKLKHIHKQRLCTKKNIHLITIDEIDYEKQPELFQNFIKNLLSPGQTVNFNLCEKQNISQEDAETFSKQNNIEIYKDGSERLGLFHNNELIFIATFNKTIKGLQCMTSCTKFGFNIPNVLEKIINKNFFQYIDLRYYPGKDKTGIDYRINLTKTSLMSSNEFKKEFGIAKIQEIIANDFNVIFDLGNDIRWYNCSAA